MSESSSKNVAKGKDGKEASGGMRKESRQMVKSSPVVGILGLQQAIGNQAVGQLLQSNAAGPQNTKGQESRHEKSVQPDSQAESNSQAELLKQAESTSGQSLEGAVRTQMEQRLGVNLGNVRVHSGTASEAAAESIDARAYTIGSDIHLGAETRHLSEQGRSRLLAHEVVHTVQQGGRPVALQGKMRVSSPSDRAEVEADSLAGAIFSPSPALAMRDQMRGATMAPPAIAQVSVPTVQRDIKDKYPVKDGTFNLNLKTESHPGGRNGMSGTIKFTASKKAPDSKNIRLLQIVRNEDLSTGKEYVWSEGEANRNSMMTAKDSKKGISPGYFVDHSAAKHSPRTGKDDADVPPYYREYWPNESESQDGSKQGETIKEASLWDYPQSSGKRRFSFETAAKDADGGYIYGTIRWGFTISDPAKGKVGKEHAKAYRGPSATFKEAVKQFDEFYKNKGSSTAPT